MDDPAAGIWQLRTQGWLGCCRTPDAEPAAIQAQTFDFMLSAYVQSDIRLRGRPLAPVVDSQAWLGDHVPIVATLLDDEGGVTGATVLAAVAKPLNSVVVPRANDSHHGDAVAGDGIYGGLLGQTDL